MYIRRARTIYNPSTGDISLVLVIAFGVLAAWKSGLLDFRSLGAEASPIIPTPRGSGGFIPKESGASNQPESPNSPCLPDDPDRVILVQFVAQKVPQGMHLFGAVYWNPIFGLDVPVFGHIGPKVGGPVSGETWHPTVQLIQMGNEVCRVFDETTTNNDGLFSILASQSEVQGSDMFARVTIKSILDQKVIANSKVLRLST